MKIILKSNDSNAQIVIDVLDNSVLRRWFDNCVKLQKICPIKGILNLYGHAPIVLRDDRHIEIYSQLLNEISNFKKLLKQKNITQFEFPTLHDTFNRDQRWCNDVHNIFVGINFYLQTHYPDHWIKSSSWENSISESSKIINSLVHKLELYSDFTKNYLSAEQYGHKRLQTHIDQNDHGLDLWFEITQEEQDLYHSTLKNDTFYDVVFSNEILGKTFYQSFLDDESTNSPAISGIDYTFGNLDLKLDDQRTAIYKSCEFQNWLESVTDNKLIAPLEFPVGSINPDSDLDYFVKRKTTEVVFHFVD
jgi:hypothetical protein